MGLNLSLKDFGEVESDLLQMAAILDTHGESRAVDRALQKAAEPVLKDMQDRASRDPRMISHALHDSIKTGRPYNTRKGLRRIKTGVFKNKLAGDVFYARFVEFGHGGPAPAPPHPYVRPAFEAQADTAFRIIREELGKAIDELKK